MTTRIKGIRGWYFTGNDFIYGEYMIINDDGIPTVENGLDGYSGEILEGVIIPGMFNAHVHTADLMAYYVCDRYMDTDLTALVAPPQGIKHRILTTNKDLCKHYIKKSIESMYSHGITGAIDFREGGVSGTEDALEIKQDIDFRFEYHVYGRPLTQHDTKKLISIVDGFGLSGIRDLSDSIIREVVSLARANGVPVAIHFSELEMEDVDYLISLRPDMAVHLCYVNTEGMEKLHKNGIFPVFCPRVNMTFATLKGVLEAVNIGMDFALGTDNLMLANTNLLFDMELLWRYLISEVRKGVIDIPINNLASMLLRAVTVSMREFLGLENNAYLLYSGKVRAIWEFAMQIMPTLRPIAIF